MHPAIAASGPKLPPPTSKSVLSYRASRPSQTLITGMVDTIHVDPIHGTVGIDGRDMSASLIDSYRQQDFVNHTASEIVTSIAQSHGLQPVVTSTQGITGRYYNDGYTKLSIGQFFAPPVRLGSSCSTGLRIPLILISHSGQSRSPIPVILIMLFTMPEEGTADSMTWRWTATTDG